MRIICICIRNNNNIFMNIDSIIEFNTIYKQQKRKIKTKKESKQYFKNRASEMNYRCKTGHRITYLDLYHILKSQKMICTLTGDRLTKENISVDHIIPVSRGGTNAVSNIRFVTKTANSMKYTQMDDELLNICRKIIYCKIEKTLAFKNEGMISI